MITEIKGSDLPLEAIMDYIVFALGVLSIPFLVLYKRKKIWIPALVLYLMCVIYITFLRYI